MKTIQKQLTSFYKAKGLKGAALNSCVKKDLKKVQKNMEIQRTEVVLAEFNNFLTSAFLWGDSPEGQIYWAARDDH